MEKFVRIELHMTKEEEQKIQKLANEEGRSRKNFCETVIRKRLSSKKEK